MGARLVFEFKIHQSFATSGSHIRLGMFFLNRDSLEICFSSVVEFAIEERLFFFGEDQDTMGGNRRINLSE